MRVVSTLFILALASASAFAQLPGDYGSNGTGGGNWGTYATTWVVCTSAGTWSGATAATSAPSGTKNVYIRSGDVVTVDASGKTCLDLRIESGATLKGNATLPTSSIVYVRIYGDTVLVDGKLGNDPTDCLSLELRNGGGTTTLMGSGSVNLARLRPNSSLSGGGTFVFAKSANINYSGSDGSGGSGIYTDNNQGASTVTITVNAGDTLFFAPKSDLRTSSSSSTNGKTNTVFNIDGVLMMPSSNIVLIDTTGRTCTMNVGGTINLGGKLTPYYASATDVGSVATITVGASGAINMLSGGTADFSNASATVTDAGTFNLGSGASIKIGALVGLDPATGPVQTTTRSFSTAADYYYSGNAAQSTGSDLPTTVGSLGVNNSYGLTMTNNIQVDSTLSLTLGTLAFNTKTLTYGTKATLAYVGTANQSTGDELFATMPNVLFQNAAGVSLMSSFAVTGSCTVTGYLAAGGDTISGAGSFTIASSGTFMTSSEYGIDGNIQVTGTKTLASGSSYSFMSPVTGSLMPATVKNLTVFTSTGLTLTNSTTCDSLYLEPGPVMATTDTLTVNKGIGGAGGFVSGNLALSVTATGTYVFPVGIGFRGYTATLDLSALTGTGTVLVSAIGDTSVAPSPAAVLFRMMIPYYRISASSGITAMTAGLTLSYNDDDVTYLSLSTDTTLHVYKSDGSLWTDLPITSRDPGNNTITLSGLTSFSQFAMGVPRPWVTIAQARIDANADLIPDHKVTGDTLLIYGVVTSPNLQGTAGTAYTVQDSTAGIYAYKGGTAMTFSRGDSVFILGKLNQYHGLTEFEPLAADTVHFGILKRGAALPAVKKMTLHEFVLNAESLESQLVEVDTLSKATGSWPATGTYTSIYLTKPSSTDTLQMYLNRYTNVPGSVEPAYPINLVGVVSQFSSGSTLNGGYELVPRDTLDISEVVLIAPPVLASPMGATGVPRRATFAWNKSVNATTYRLQVATDSAFTAVVFDTTMADTTKKLGTPLAATTKHFWRVSASATGGQSGYSVIASFTTGTGIDAVNDLASLPKVYELYQNYPNPFNPSTIIRYDLPKNSMVKVTIYDVLGRVVANLVDGVQTANRYSLTWSPAGLSSGIYFCRIQAKSQTDGSSFVSVKKLLFVK